ncbi:hypothetical protein [Verrucomicrobium spinosum]|uniref:hypothetical protein n=1 Tax=Verrucomicrobium spinosum TaxID=2736 RepID=UPI000946878A|nr:hypothetical protein [Verrucomicrobium spinosum]
MLGAAPPPEPKKTDNVAVERLPWPLMDGRKGSAAAPTTLLSALDNVPGLEQSERDRIRQFLTMPRSEFSEVPDDVSAIRLRAVEELARMQAGKTGWLIWPRVPCSRKWKRPGPVLHGRRPRFPCRACAEVQQIGLT